MARPVLVDTSAWIEAFRPEGDSKIRSAVKAAAREGRAVLCDMVLLELWNGARGSDEREAVRQLEEEVERVPTTPEAWKASFALARRCRASGLTLPASDLLIMACAEYHGLGLLHHDAHFENLARLRGKGIE